MDLKGLILFDIDGVIRDVSSSYRLALQKTVQKVCNWEPSFQDIDNLKMEGIWNNDWDASLELIKRYLERNAIGIKCPSKKKVEEIFNDFYFGKSSTTNQSTWAGFIKNETLLVQSEFFTKLTKQKIGWGFVSGAELPSAKFVLENQLGLINPPLIAMGDAPDKPNPTGLIKLAKRILQNPLGRNNPAIAYLGDTVADVITIKNARKEIPSQKFISLAISPPHLHFKDKKDKRLNYELSLKEAGADQILQSINDLIEDKEILNK